MKKILWILSIILICFGCAKQPPHFIPSPPNVAASNRLIPPGWKEVKDQNISYLVPDTWTKVSEGYLAPDSKAVVVHLADPIAVGFDTFISNFSVALINQGDSILVVRPGILEDRPMAFWMLHGPETFVQIVAVQDNKIVHSLICGTTLYKIFYYQNICLEIVNSIHFE